VLGEVLYIKTIQIAYSWDCVMLQWTGCSLFKGKETPPKNIALWHCASSEWHFFFLFYAYILKKKKVEHDVAKVRRMIRYVQDYLVIRCMPISFFHHKVSPHTLTQLLYRLWWRKKTLKVMKCLGNYTLQEWRKQSPKK